MTPHTDEEHAAGHTRGPQENQQPHVYDRLDGNPTLGIHRRQQAAREHETRDQEASNDESSHETLSLVDLQALVGHRAALRPLDGKHSLAIQGRLLSSRSQEDC